MPDIFTSKAELTPLINPPEKNDEVTLDPIPQVEVENNNTEIDNKTEINLNEVELSENIQNINVENIEVEPDENKSNNPPPENNKGFNLNPSNVESLPGHTHFPLASYCYFPHNVDFITEEPDEKVILLVRRHIITNFGWIALVFLMIFAPILLKYFPLLDFFPLRFQTVALLFWYLLTLAIAIQGFLSWFFSVNIVTNKRVIDIDFENLIYRKITDAKIDHIEDATVKMGSVIRTLFDFGDVLIQTAAEIPEVEFYAVPHPDRIDKLLSDLRLESQP